MLEFVEFKMTHGTCYDTDVHRFFFEVPQFGSSRPVPKIDLEKNQNGYRMKNPMA